MKQPAAFRGTYSDWRLVKTRAVVQVIFEVPLADSDAAYEVLGGMPVHGNERWFGIAAINLGKEAMPDNPQHITPTAARPQPSTVQAGAKRGWKDLLPTQQAGIRCDDPIFAAYLKEQRVTDWREAQTAAECVRLICGITSRTELATNHKARMIWHQLDTQYQAWLAAERVGA